MAAIITDEDFKLAAGQWQSTQVLPAGRAWYQDAPARRIYQEIPGQPNLDVTPSTPVLEAALDTVLAAIALEATRETARALLVEAKEYLRTQLEAVSPALAPAQVAFIKPKVDGNVFLLRRMTRLIAIANTSYGWSLTVNPASSPNYERYLEIFIQMVGLET